MNSIEAAIWLRRFYSPFSRAEVPGDDLGSTFGLCGAVILASVLTASRSPESLGALTGMPTAFTAVVMGNMDYMNLWQSENFEELCRTIRRDHDDYDEIEDALHGVLEDFWCHSTLPGVTDILPALRGRSLLFGRSQTWIHNEFLERLIGPKLVYGKSSQEC